VKKKISDEEPTIGARIYGSTSEMECKGTYEGNGKMSLGKDREEIVQIDEWEPLRNHMLSNLGNLGW